MSHSSKPSKTPKVKTSKPYPEYPLYARAAGVWAKRIRGKLYYFGPWDDPDGALKKYEEQKDAFHAGRKPRPDVSGASVKEVGNAFLNHKKALLEAHELSPRTWAEYKATTDLLIAHFGKSRLVADIGPDDFATLRANIAAKQSPVCLGNDIPRVRSVFKHAFEVGLIDRPVRFGPGFKRPSKKVLRLEHAKKGPRMFEAAEICRLIDEASAQVKAMILNVLPLTTGDGFGCSWESLLAFGSPGANRASTYTEARSPDDLPADDAA